MIDEDLEKLDFYLKSEFEFHEGILFSQAIKFPTGDKLLKLKNQMSTTEIERLYNHFHMSAITYNVDRQIDFSIQIWKKWRAFFIEKMKSKNIIIETCDLGEEIILYVYQSLF